MRKIATAGKLWDNEDFKMIKMDDYCNKIEASMEDANGGDVRIFCAWEETLEKKKLMTNGDVVLESRFINKYHGLKWLDCDTEYCQYKTHPVLMYFEKKRGNNQYHAFGLKGRYDLKLEPDEWMVLWEPWERNNNLFELITEYYKDITKVRRYLR